MTFLFASLAIKTVFCSGESYDAPCHSLNDYLEFTNTDLCANQDTHMYIQEGTSVSDRSVDV